MATDGQILGSNISPTASSLNLTDTCSPINVSMNVIEEPSKTSVFIGNSSGSSNNNNNFQATNVNRNSEFAMQSIIASLNNNNNNNNNVQDNRPNYAICKNFNENDSRCSSVSGHSSVSSRSSVNEHANAQFAQNNPTIHCNDDRIDQRQVESGGPSSGSSSSSSTTTTNDDLIDQEEDGEVAEDNGQIAQVSESASAIASSFNNINVNSNNNNNNNVKQVELFGVKIVALTINSRDRLCLAQISNTLLREFSYNEIHNRRVALGITCVQCTPIQLELLRRAGAMPSSSRRCGMITMREAERLCRSFLVEEQPPELPDNFYFTVAHRINYGCRGRFVPARYISSRAKCIECFFCGDFFSPNKFIFHSHRQPNANECNPPDSPNINSWRKHIDLDWNLEHSQEIKYAWEDVKSLFNGGTRKRGPNNQSFNGVVATTSSVNSRNSFNLEHEDTDKQAVSELHQQKKRRMLVAIGSQSSTSNNNNNSATAKRTKRAPNSNSSHKNNHTKINHQSQIESDQVDLDVDGNDDEDESYGLKLHDDDPIHFEEPNLNQKNEKFKQQQEHLKSTTRFLPSNNSKISKQTNTLQQTLWHLKQQQHQIDSSMGINEEWQKLKCRIDDQQPQQIFHSNTMANQSNQVSIEPTMRSNQQNNQRLNNMHNLQAQFRNNCNHEKISATQALIANSRQFPNDKQQQQQQIQIQPGKLITNQAHEYNTNTNQILASSAHLDSNLQVNLHHQQQQQPTTNNHNNTHYFSQPRIENNNKVDVAQQQQQHARSKQNYISSGHLTNNLNLPTNFPVTNQSNQQQLVVLNHLNSESATTNQADYCNQQQQSQQMALRQQFWSSLFANLQSSANNNANNAAQQTANQLSMINSIDNTRLEHQAIKNDTNAILHNQQRITTEHNTNDIFSHLNPLGHLLAAQLSSQTTVNQQQQHNFNDSVSSDFMQIGAHRMCVDLHQQQQQQQQQQHANGNLNPFTGLAVNLIAQQQVAAAAAASAAAAAAAQVAQTSSSSSPNDIGVFAQKGA